MLNRHNLSTNKNFPSVLQFRLSVTPITAKETRNTTYSALSWKKKVH